jgi:hypothetical protein
MIPRSQGGRQAQGLTRRRYTSHAGPLGGARTMPTAFQATRGRSHARSGRGPQLSLLHGRTRTLSSRAAWLRDVCLHCCPRAAAVARLLRACLTPRLCVVAGRYAFLGLGLARRAALITYRRVGPGAALVPRRCAPRQVPGLVGVVPRRVGQQSASWDRLRRLKGPEGRRHADWFSPHALRRACAAHMALAR